MRTMSREAQAISRIAPSPWSSPNRIRALKTHTGWNNTQLAAEIGGKCTGSMVSRWLTGAGVHPDYCRRLAEIAERSGFVYV